MKKGWIWFVSMALVIPLAGCGGQRANDIRFGNTPLLVDEQIWQQENPGEVQLQNLVDLHENTRMETSDTLAQVVEQLQGVEDAVVIRTDYNAYVGVKMDSSSPRGGEVSSTRAKIVLAVKTADSKLMNVFVSSRPEVYKTLSSYTRKLANGVSERRLIRSFNTRMKRQFPYRELDQ